MSRQGGARPAHRELNDAPRPLWASLSAATSRRVLLTRMPAGAAVAAPIDALFEEAVQAVSAGVLRGVRFDSELGYPTEIDLHGPPDTSGSVFATGLQPIP